MHCKHMRSNGTCTLQDYLPGFLKSDEGLLCEAVSIEDCDLFVSDI